MCEFSFLTSDFLFSLTPPNIDEDLTRQLSLIESNFEQFGNNIAQFFEDTNKQLDSSIKSGLDDISDSVRNSVSQNLEQYKGKIEELFSDITVKNDEQLNFVTNMTTGDTYTVRVKITDVGEVIGYQADIIEFVK